MTMRWYLPSTVLVIALAVTACAAPGGGTAVRPAVAVDGVTDGLAGFLARAVPGESAAVERADGRPVTVTVVKDYHAASGRACRRLLLGDGGEAPSARVACRDDDGTWRLLPRLKNRDLPRLAPAARGGGTA